MIEDLEGMRDANKVFVEQMDAAELSPGEFSHRVRACVDRENIRTVAIASDHTGVTRIGLTRP